MGRHNGSKKANLRIVPPPDVKSGEVVQLHPLVQFQQQERLVPFGQLKVGDQFKIPRSKSSPKDVESPVFEKILLTRKDIDDPVSRLCNYKVGSHKDWLPDVLDVIPFF